MSGPFELVEREIPELCLRLQQGDGAFVARPHVAAGVSKAALDAAALKDYGAPHLVHDLTARDLVA